MLQLFETICCQNGVFQRIPFHEERMNRSRNHFFGSPTSISLMEFLKLPDLLNGQTVKCRVTYSVDIENIEYEIYNQTSINSLRLVQDDSIVYNFKFRNRDQLYRLWQMRGDSDEILIVKDGFITDTSFSNIIFLRNGKWYTPKYPLLNGTRREFYLQEKLVLPELIKPIDLFLYEEARLINSMRSIEDGKSIRIADIATLP